MNSALRTWASRLAVSIGVTALAGFPNIARGDSPSYAQTASVAETVQGTIFEITGRYTLTLQDDRGFIDNVTLHAGTIITPTGLSLGSGQVATLTGRTSGKTFDAEEIDVDPGSISSGQSLLPGGDYLALTGAGYPAYAFGYDSAYVGAYGSGYYGQALYGGFGAYAPAGYYPGYGTGYGRGGTYVPPNGTLGAQTGGATDPLPRRPVRVPVGNPPPGYRAPTGGNRAPLPVYRPAPVMRSNPAPAAPRSAPGPSTSRSY